MNIEDVHNNRLFNSLFGDHSFIKHDITLNNFKKYMIEVTQPIQFNITGLDTDEVLNEHLYSEVELYVYKEIFTTISNNTENFDYINFFGKNIDDGLLYKDIINLILDNNYNFVVVSGRIGTILQDSHDFNLQSFSNTSLRASSSPYIIGNIGSIKIFVDPYMKFTDNRIIMFNGVYLNLQNLNKVEDMSSIKFSFNVDINLSSSKIVFIIDSEKSDGYLQYKSFIRNINIDNILKEDT